MGRTKPLTDTEREIVASCQFAPHYSGSVAHKFWTEVRHGANDRVLYDFACALEDLEARVLAAVNEGVRVRAEKLVRTKAAGKMTRVGRR